MKNKKIWNGFFKKILLWFLKKRKKKLKKCQNFKFSDEKNSKFKKPLKLKISFKILKTVKIAFKTKNYVKKIK